MDLSIIVVNWRSAAFVAQCLKSIRKEEVSLRYEIIVVDNASFDGCDRALREQGLDATYIQSEKNLGFAGANNLAFSASQGRSVLFLNPDTEMRGPAIQRLYDALRRLSSAGAVGPKLLNADGSIQTSCIQSFPTLLNQTLDFEFLRRRFPLSSLWGMAPLHVTNDEPAEVEVISGACLMITREAFEQVGRFSEDYFMYGEDADLCLKLRKAGYKSCYVPDATVVHFGGSSSGQATSGFSAMMTREALLRYFQKWHGGFYAVNYRGATLLVSLFRLAVLIVLLPIQWLPAKKKASAGSIQKWWAILRWSVCGQPRTRQDSTGVSPAIKQSGFAGAVK